MKIRIQWQTHKANFRYPAGATPRTAILVNWFRESPNIYVFRKGWNDAAARLAPEAVVATWPQFQGLMAHKLVAPERAVIVVSRPGDPLLTARRRDELWKAFHVPVFEQLIDLTGRLLAAECEAHDGLHVEADPPPAVEDHTLDPHPCACGRKTPRLIPVKPAELVRAIATYAR